MTEREALVKIRALATKPLPKGDWPPAVQAMFTRLDAIVAYCDLAVPEGEGEEHGRFGR